MKDTDFEIALRRFDTSDPNDKIGYEKHYYNDFSGLESEEAYHNHLQSLYDNYVVKINETIEKQSFINPNALSNYIQSKLTMLNNTKKGWDEKEYIFDTWKSTIETTNKYYFNSQYARNERDTLQFWLNCVGSQYHFMDKIIVYLTQLSNTDIIQPQPSTEINQKEDNVTNENHVESSNAKNIVKEISKDVLTRKGACEFLQITNRKLTTLLTAIPPKINPITRTSKPYTFNRKELERYVNQNIDN